MTDSRIDASLPGRALSSPRRAIADFHGLSTTIANAITPCPTTAHRAHPLPIAYASVPVPSAIPKEAIRARLVRLPGMRLL